MFTRAIVFAVSCSALAFGCGAEPGDGVEDTQEIVDNLIQVGFPADDIMVVDGVVYTGRDAEVSLEASREMLDTAYGDEQYRTSNLVGANISTICVNGATFTGRLGQALNLAITNYNNQGLSFTMRRTTGSTAGCSATITARVSGGTGGSAGFPSGGRPFNRINIGSGLRNFDVNTIEHVITHELGHCIGFRHSDFFNRSISCGGQAINEENPPSGIGAIHIPGTPTGAVVGQSIMNSCFRTLENGEFTASDVTALRALY
jgi:Dual-action HEIGH metallo-peptidase